MKTIEYIIQKDVVRTDRSNPFYAGDDNPNVLLMKLVTIVNTIHFTINTRIRNNVGLKLSCIRAESIVAHRL